MFLFCFALLESSGGKAATPNAFIFSLSNSEGLAPFVSKVKDTEKAIERSPNDGPLFGQDLFIFLTARLGSHTHPWARATLFQLQ